jgi:tRNA threonylcarbamoyladenosine biosynthesis protein TsaE
MKKTNEAAQVASSVQTLQSLFEMQEFAAQFGASLKTQPRLILLLDGEMGAGKTTFTRFLLEALGCHEVASPTFAFHHRYDTAASGVVEHFDFYRLQSEDDLESIGFWDCFQDGSQLVIIEWAKRLKELSVFDQLPLAWAKTEFVFSRIQDEGKPLEDELREVTIRSL